jgi:hypothetical protein
MTTNRLAKSESGRSPTDPRECCDWANDRLHPDAANTGLRWYTTGNKDRPIALMKAL